MRSVPTRTFVLGTAASCGLAGYCMALILSVSPHTGYAQPPGKAPSPHTPPQTVNGAPPAATAVTPVAGPPPVGAPSDKDRDNLSGDFGNTDQHTGLTNMRNWVYTRDGLVISGSTGRYNEKADTVDSDDPVVLDDKKHHITSDKAHVEHVEKKRSLRLVVLTGHAVMVLKPDLPANSDKVAPAAVQPPGSSQPGVLKPVGLSGQQPTAPNPQTPTDPAPPEQNSHEQKEKEERSHGGTATCDKLEYKTAAKYATLTGHVVFKQSFLDKDGKQVERTTTCEHAEYDGKLDQLHLFKPVHFESNQKQNFDTTDDMIIGTKEGEEKMTYSHFKISFERQEDDEDATPGDPKKNDPKSSADQGAKKPVK